MTASVVEAKSTQGNVAAHTLTFTTTPAAGDIVVVAWVCMGTGARTFTVAGMGGTWTVYSINQAANNNTGFAVGTGVSAAGNVVVTNSNADTSMAAAYLVRGSDPLGNVRLQGQTTVTAIALAGPTHLARNGEFVCATVINNSSGIAAWPNVGSLPAPADWTPARGVEVRNAAYATPSAASANYQINVTNTGSTPCRIAQIVVGEGDHKASVGGVYTEVLGEGLSQPQIGGVYTESLGEGLTKAQVGGVYTEVLGTHEGLAQVEAVYAETLVVGTARAQVEAVYAEALVTGLETAQVEAVYAEALVRKVVPTADPAYRAAVLADSPLGYWRLDETFAAVITDYGPNAIHGTYSGAVLGKDPLHAGSVGSVQGTAAGNGIGTVPNHASWAVGETFSLECWLMPTNTADVAGIVGRYTSATGGWVIWQRRGKLGVVTVKSGTQTDQDGYTLEVDVPMHFVLVSVPGRLKMYINGDMAFTWSPPGTYNAAVNTTGLQFGAYAGAGQYSSARLSDVAFYGVALTEAQIRAHLAMPWPPAATDPATVPGLIGRWDALAIPGMVDGAPVGSWNDTSGGAKHLASIGSTSNPVLKKATFNGRQVVRFDGANDGLVATVVPTGADNKVTIIAVHALRSLASSVAAAPVTMQPSPSTNSGYGMVIKATTGERSIFSVGSSALYGGGVYTAGTWERWTLYSNESQSVMYVNGVVVESSTAIAGVAAYLRLAGSPTQTLPAASDIAEVLVFDRVLTSYEIAQIDLYLKAKWFDTVAPPESAPAFVGWGSPRIQIDAPAPAFPVASYREAVLANTPLAYWRFGGGTNVLDETGNARHLSLQTPANAVFTTGAYDDKLAMYGGTPGVVAYGAWLGIATWELELVFTFRPAALGNASNTIVDRDQTPSRGFQVNANFVGGIGIIQYIQTVGSISSFLTSGHPDLRDGLPHHLVINQGGGQLKMYIDGVQRGGGANAQQAASTSPLGVAGSFVGGSGSGGYPVSQQMAGVAIDELAFYDHVSTPEAIAARHTVLRADIDFGAARVSTPYDLAVAADSPTRRFRLDESSKSYHLFSPNWAHGTYTGGVFSAPALVNGRPLDRSAVVAGSQYATVDIPVAATAFSVEMWLAPDSTPGGQFVAGRWEGTLNYSWFIYRAGTGISATMYFAGDKAVSCSVPLVLDAPNHVVLTYDGANIRLYVNGQLGGTLAQTGNATAGGTTRLGRIWINSAHYTGKIDEVASYSSVLSLARIQAHYAAGFTPVWSSNVAWSDDFDAQTSWPITGWSVVNAGALSSATRTGAGKCVTSNGGAQAIASKYGLGNLAARSFGFWFKIVALPGATNYVAVVCADSGGDLSAVSYLKLSPTGQLILTDQNVGGTVRGTTPAGTVVAGAWHRIDITATHGTGTSGALELWVDNSKLLDITGIPVVSTSGAVGLAAFGMYSHCGDVAFDDVTITNNATRATVV